MNVVLRLVMMWVLVLAVPFQGVAAATMVSCGMVHEHSIAHLGAYQHPDGALAEAVHSHPGAVADHYHNHASADHGEDGKTASGTGFTHKCGACAACCSGAAAPTGSLTLGAVKLADFYAPLVTRSVAAYVAEGLERPPRLSFA